MALEEKKDVREVREEQGFKIRSIDDIGEHIGGARKDIIREGRINWAIYETMSHKEKQELLTRDNIWPRPDWRSLTRSPQPDGGQPMEPEAAARIDGIRRNLTKAFEDLPYSKRKPTEDAAQDIYMKGLNWLAENFDKYKTYEDTQRIRHDFMTFMDMPVLRDMKIATDADELEAMKQLDTLNIFTKQAKNARNPKGDPLASENTAKHERKAKIRPYDFNGNTPEEMSSWEIQPVFGKGVRLRYINRNFEMDIPAKGNNLIFGPKDGPGNYQEPNQQTGIFKSIDEAMDWTKNNTAKIVQEVGQSNKMGKRGQYKLRRANLATIEREGPPLRIVGLITEEKLKNDFGLRAVEFGESVTDKERRALVYHSYQAFSDLADALQIRKQDIGLNNSLAFALGSRGKSSAAAHYEPARQTINITRMKGAGNLAHEWGHAFEHHITKEIFPAHEHNKTFMSVYAIPKATEDSLYEPYKGKIGLDKNVKKKAIKSYLELRDALFFAKPKTANYEKAVEFMKGKGNKENSKETIEYASRQKSDYFSNFGILKKLSPRMYDYYISGPEMFARSFEAYIYDKLEGMGRKNDFLVNSVGEKNQKNHGWGFSPYPVGEDRKAITKAMENVIEPRLTLERVRRQEEDRKFRQQERQRAKEMTAQMEKYRELEQKLALQRSLEKPKIAAKKEMKGPSSQTSFDF